mmetsp:Transcript_7769/g.16530  ORF Transcript_7769/g.16530 Transcript_7769/m.16530 type:complete len:218 (+) Transcript_7769:118-771(+)
MPTSYLECNRCGLVVERQGWKIQTSGPCEHQAEHGCPGELSKVSGRFQTAFFGPGSWQERAQQPCFCKSLRYLQCNSCGMVRKEQGWHSGDAECEHRHPHGCPGTMCDMTAGGSLAHDPLPEWELQMKQACNCVNPDFTLRIASLAGEILELGVRNDWTIAQAKAKMERVHNIRPSMRASVLEESFFTILSVSKSFASMKSLLQYPGSGDIQMWLPG